jgi:hypothetical protein
MASLTAMAWREALTNAEVCSVTEGVTEAEVEAEGDCFGLDVEEESEEG